MQTRRYLPVLLAVAGCGAIVVGIYQGLVHVAPGYEGTIMTGWDGDPNHEEYLLAQLGVVGIAGAVASLRWKRLAAVSVGVGGIVLFYTLRAVAHYLREPGLYTEVSTYGGDSVVLILGAEPFLLGIGGLLFAGAGITRVRLLSTHSGAALSSR